MSRYGVGECDYCHKTEKLRIGQNFKWLTPDGWLQQIGSLYERDYCSEECALAFKQHGLKPDDPSPEQGGA
jgi:hypothetical protein